MSDLVPYEPGQEGQQQNGLRPEQPDALAEYLARARVWEQAPWLMDRELARYGLYASVVCVALGLVGVWAASMTPSRGFFLVGSVALPSFIGFVLAMAKMVLVVGVAGLVVSAVSWSRPTGTWSRLAIVGECVVAATAAVADGMVVAVLALELVLWLLLILLVILVVGAVLAVFGAASG